MPLSRIGVSLHNQVFDHSNHRRDVLGGTWHVVRFDRPHCPHVIKEPLDRLIRDIANAATAFSCACVDLVIHIREVAHVGDVFVPIHVTQQSVEHIKHNHRTRVPKVGTVIYRGPTNIHPHVFVINGRELLPFGPCLCVV